MGVRAPQRPAQRGTRQRVRHPAITMSEALSFADAWQHARALGYPLNLFASVNWAHAPSAAHAIERIGRLRDAAKSFLRRHAPGLPVLWVECREKPRTKGEGVHLALHVPEHLQTRITSAMAGWVAASGDDFAASAVDVRPVGPRWWDRRDYMLKGSDAEVRARFDTDRFRKGSQGVIEGPRVRVAHALGRKARAEWAASQAEPEKAAPVQKAA